MDKLIQENVPPVFQRESESFSANFRLSNREFDVVKALLRNITNSEEVAKHLGISTHTVNNHLKSIFEKTGTNSKTEILACFLNFASDSMNNCKMFSRKPRILVIDDEEVICEHIDRVMSERGMKVYTTTDPEEALGLVHKLNLDFIVCDVRMPQMGGISFLKEVRKTHQYFPYVIFITGFKDYSLEEALSTGAAGYIEKPVDMDKLFTMIMEVLIELPEETDRLLGAQSTDPVVIQGNFRIAESDIGYGGAFIPMDAKMEKNKKIGVGTIVDLTLQPKSFDRSIKVQGRVVWKRPEEKAGLRRGIGVKFLGMSEADKDAFLQYCRSHTIESFIPEGAGLATQAADA